MIGIHFRDVIQTYEESKDTILMTETYPINDEEMNNWINELENSYEQLKKFAIQFANDNMILLTETEQIKYCKNNCPVRLSDTILVNLPKTLKFIYENRNNNINYFKEFGNIVKKYIKHVSFNEMMDTIEKVSQEIASKINNIETNKYDKILFIVDNIAKKSNTWIFLLFIKYLKDNINVNRYNDILFTNNMNNSENYQNGPLDQYSSYGDIFNLETFVNENNYNDSKILCIYFDDMSYSGSQISMNISNFNLDNVDYYLGVAYISSKAIETIKNKFNIKIKLFNSTEQIQILKEKINDNEKIILEKIEEYYSYFFKIDSIINKPLIYFDHKIADNVSTIQTILLLKIIPFQNYDETYQLTSLFDNCEIIEFNNNNYYNILNNDLSYTDLTIEFKNLFNNNASHYMCPNTFYKQNNVIYKFNNRIINKNNYLFKEIEIKKGTIKININNNITIDVLNEDIIRDVVKENTIGTVRKIIHIVIEEVEKVLDEDTIQDVIKEIIINNIKEFLKDIIKNITKEINCTIDIKNKALYEIINNIQDRETILDLNNRNQIIKNVIKKAIIEIIQTIKKTIDNEEIYEEEYIYTINETLDILINEIINEIINENNISNNDNYLNKYLKYKKKYLKLKIIYKIIYNVN